VQSNVFFLKYQVNSFLFRVILKYWCHFFTTPINQNSTKQNSEWVVEGNEEQARRVAGIEEGEHEEGLIAATATAGSAEGGDDAAGGGDGDNETLKSDWVEYFDNEGETYYSNLVTGDVSWHKPEHFRPYASIHNNGGLEEGGGGDYATPRGEGIALGSGGHSPWSPPPPKDAEHGWVVVSETTEQGAQHEYFMKPSTGETKWEAPHLHGKQKMFRSCSASMHRRVD
jgi:hypothetical protein